jgi:preprotein translocase subunit SecY/protein transport protein SEC61 subunit alpha
MRVIFASQHGTLLELGIGPIVTAGLLIQLAAGSLIEFDNTDPEQRALFTTASKVFSLIMVIVQATMYIVSGAYGKVELGTALILFLQLLGAGMVIMMLDELVQKGWGIGSGISLFIVAGITKNIWWSSLSLYVVSDGKRFGAIPAFFESIIRGEPIWNWFHRTGGSGTPDMIGLLMTLAVFAFVVYVEGMRVELPISHSSFRGFRAKMPIKLLYVSNIPVILAYALFGNIQLGGQLIWSRWNRDNSNFWFNLIGTYNSTTNYPTGGLAYYVTSPGSLDALIQTPLRALIYFCIVVAICLIFALTWLEIGGLGAENMADQLLGSGMQVPGFRRSKRPITNLLNRYIPTITIIGGTIIGVLAAVSEFFGVFGSGMGALLCVSIMYQYYQTMVQEQVEDLYPFLRGAFR